MESKWEATGSFGKRKTGKLTKKGKLIKLLDITKDPKAREWLSESLEQLNYCGRLSKSRSEVLDILVKEHNIF